MTITKDDLEAIRSAAIAYYSRRTEDIARTFVAELRRGIAETIDGTRRIGIWTIEQKDEGLAVVRQPPVSPEMRYFGLWIEKRGKDWLVTGELFERETLELD